MMQYDKIILPQMTFWGRHGVFAEEKAVPQEFVVDLTLYLDLRKAALSDDLSQTVHYGLVFMAVKKIVETHSYDLIERLAQVIADSVLADKKVVKVQVAVEKTDAKMADCSFRAQVVLERGRD